MAPLRADPLAEHILIGIEQGMRPTAYSALLLSRDLGWFQQNLEGIRRASPVLVDQVQRLRVEVVAEASRRAAPEFKESTDLFFVTGPGSPGRDLDVLYIGRQPDRARELMASAVEAVTAEMHNRHAGTDPLLRLATGNPELRVPRHLSARSMSIVTSDLPDFGYGDLSAAFRRAKTAAGAGDGAQAVQQLRQDSAGSLRRDRCRARPLKGAARSRRGPPPAKG